MAANSGNLEKTDYLFNGWNTNADGSGTHYSAGGTYTAEADDTLYAEWISVVKLLASDGAAYDQFGMSVSISGDYAIIGADGVGDNGSYSGSAYIYKRNAL